MQEVGNLVYFESLLLCLLIIGVLFCANIRYWKPVIINRLSLVYIFVSLTIIFYGLWALVEGNPDLKFFNALFTVCSSITLTLSCLFYYYFVLEKVGIFFNNGKFWYLSSIILLVVSSVFTILSIWFGFTFVIDANGCYQRGPVFFLDMIAQYSYVALGVIFAIYKSFKSDLNAEKHKYMIFALSIVPTVLLGILNNILNYPYGLPVLFFGITISLLIVFASSAAGLVTRDPLTGLLNRAAFDSKLNNAIKRRGNNNLHLMILDINRFKGINDNFGHSVGDVVLVKLSDVLESFSENTNTVVGRWGGDEFVIYVENKEDKEIKDLAKLLKKRVSNECNEDPRFNVSISVGYSKLREFENVKHFFDEADHMLYEDKQKFHNANK